jgi:hypothetical protein
MGAGLCGVRGLAAAVCAGGAGAGGGGANVIVRRGEGKTCGQISGAIAMQAASAA